MRYGSPMTERRYAAAGVDLAARSQFAKSLPGILAQARRPEFLTAAGPFSGLFRLVSAVGTPAWGGSGQRAKADGRTSG